MLRPLPLLALGALLSLPLPQAMALGFGRVSNATVLGQPLNFTVGVRLDGDEGLSIDCVAVEVYSGESRLLPSTVRVSIEPGGEPSERTVHVISSGPIDEPVVSVSLQLSCSNRIARKFVAFIDPPVVTLAQVAPPAPVPAPGPAGARSTPPAEPAAVAVAAATGPQPASKATLRSPSRSRRAARPATTHPAPGAATAVAGSATARPARAPSPAIRTARLPAPPTGSRLMLEAADHEATRERLNLRLTETLAALPAQAASGAETAASAAEADGAQRARERVQALEDSLTKLRSESQATQASLAQLQLRLREAEAQRSMNPLLLALVALAAALAGAVGVLLWKRASERGRSAQWWTPPEAVVPAVDDGAHAADEWTGHVPGGVLDQRRPLPQEEAVVVETTASPMLLTQVHAAAQAASDAATPPPSEPQHEMSVEELIDLEQQAEFFVVLGQDEAAIDLLMGHLRSSGGASPLPYLKLLEIYRRRNEREAFERVRERFNRRFNAYAPDWQSDPQQGRSLLDYPGVVSRLQAIWATPTQAMQALEASLFRRDAGNSTFDLPAYRELLFLYSVARDLSERGGAAVDVDLLLPIGGDAVDAEPLTLLHPTAARASVDTTATVDVDISRFDADPSPGDDPPSRFRTDFSPTSGSMGMADEPVEKARR